MRRFLAAASAAALCSFPALAQVPPPGPPPGPPPHAGGHHGPGALACAIRDGKAAEFLAGARADLRVTEAQSRAWEAFAAQVDEAVRPLGERCEPGAGPGERGRPPLPERLARMERGQRAMLEATSKVRAAVDALWPSLSEEQRRAAGRLMSPRRHGRGLPPGPPAR